MTRASGASIGVLLAGASLSLTCGLVGCAGGGDWLSSSGPSKGQIVGARQRSSPSIPVVDITEPAVRRIVAAEHQQQFSASLGIGATPEYAVGAGDWVGVSIWEAPPAMLFTSSFGPASGGAGDITSGNELSRQATVPDQMVAEDGTVSVPFAGSIEVAGKTPHQIERALMHALAGKANRPQVLVTVTRNVSANVDIVGEVAKSLQMPLTAKGERVLDGIAAAGGLRDPVPVQKATVRITRGSTVVSMPLTSVIEDPNQNVRLAPGDVLTVFYQPLSLTVLGAATKNQELMFEAQGISLTQALARAQGLQDTTADARGVFVFRFENREAVADAAAPAFVARDGRIPLVYRLDLKNPASFLVAQKFPMRDGDVIYISNAPAAQLQKFLTIVVESVYATEGVVHVGGN
ncbi:MAG: polysaccharide biosynthesis/export family protein [Gammaproteobacteria bacterium]|nr:polysaccharide biosynthesis/export family protein [Gammaproteobacteria bacterium]